jgi:hypothetical protein
VSAFRNTGRRPGASIAAIAVVSAWHQACSFIQVAMSHAITHELLETIEDHVLWIAAVFVIIASV